jgi:hypothetical protein
MALQRCCKSAPFGKYLGSQCAAVTFKTAEKAFCFRLFTWGNGIINIITNNIIQMKKLVFSLLMLIFSVVSANAESTVLNLEMKDGTTHSFLLSDMPTITMADDKLTVTTKSATVSYALYDVKQYKFGVPTGISPVTKDKQYSLSGEELIFNDVKSVNGIAAFSVGGERVNVDAVVQNGKAVISLSALPSGIYIIKVNGITVKIQRK